MKKHRTSAECHSRNKPAPQNYDEIIWKAVGRFDTYIGSTNVKAGLLLGFNTFVFTGVILKVDELIPKGYPIRHIAVLVILATIVVSAFTCLILTIQIVRPDLSRTEKEAKSIIYYGDVAQFKTADEYIRTVRLINRDAAQEDIYAQAYVLARIATRKFQKLRQVFSIMLWGQILPLAGLVLIKFSILIQSAWQTFSGK